MAGSFGYHGHSEQEVMDANMDRNALADEVLRKLRAIAMTDVTALLQVENGQLLLKDTAQLDPDGQAAIASMEKGTGGIKVKFYDRLKALELLGKYLCLFEQQPPAGPRKSTLLQEIVASTKEVIDTHDLPEIQQATAAGHDLVEQTQPTAP